MEKAKYKCDLDTCFLCKTCVGDWKPAIELNKQNYRVKKGQDIFKEGDPVTGIYFVYEGFVKVHKKWDDEKDLIIRFAKKGDILGHLGLEGNFIYPVTATALDKVTVCFLPMDFFESSLNINNGFAVRLMRFFAGELQNSEKRMRNLAHMPVKGRVAQALITLKKQFGVNEDRVINIELAKQDLASFSGAAYESLFRTINDLVADNIISVAGKSISIKDDGKLLQLIQNNEY
ncbi:MULTISPECIES: Crp/Fnr family transcriptional regulator [unclassified Mucilaginibacter]|uniref:Crp/Fnr family transcriptional regulator n=1 Tax=unclassified Mucilaginibacter TaxID=2617802 RepID=UPI002AC89A1D|nr:MULTISPECIES: Crp/Fnr family transcriptional regulator [unclassified Mucilaginibacter]MEB0261159.1 Crp/Fnr family transcriptional regulator [Mucilaginibacter sp. 10I4]MEB0279627.1 Crp/Fnr family transcriptional regulator [Mucilaginibacter sp. 10B2]MEB0300311.1 Crp/Fnr family transcriptional regulator [Mucilaginibacter sp. 5C4]WPX22506.1 Crp/Fnr family transcriptional regulator [Mucilaginibacter sp. 5C4]